MAKTKTDLFVTNHDLAADTRIQMINDLNQTLADLFDLFSQTKQAHWNVKGHQFFFLHELFDGLAATLTADIDNVAERAAQMGGVVKGTARMSVEASRLEEFPLVFESIPVVKALSDRFAAAAKYVRKSIDIATDAGDMDTADLYTEVSRNLDKSLWFLEAHLQS